MGGKWRIAPWIISHFPPHDRYVEPFGGSAAVLLRKEPVTEEVYNDLDSNIVNFFRVLRDPEMGAALRQQLELTPFSREEYYASFEGDVSDPVERARRVFIQASMSYNAVAAGMGKVSGFRLSGNKMIVGLGSDWRNRVDALSAVSDRLRGVTIENQKASALIAAYDHPDALFYVDPPYPRDTRGHVEYQHDMKSEDSHDTLAKVLHAVRGMVVLSGYASALYDSRYGDWYRDEIVTVGACDGKSKRGRERTEVLWMNPRAAEALENTLYPLLGKRPGA